MSNGDLHQAILERSAVYFGWSSFEEYKQRRRRQSGKLINQVYHMPLQEKRKLLKTISIVSEYERENGIINLG